MTAEEIYISLAKHIKTGIEMHHEMSQVYDFLTLKGYKKCHEFHFYEETRNYIHLCHYYMQHYHKLLKVDDIPSPNVIPASWFKYAREDVDPGTKRTGVQTISKKWFEWETSTKNLFCDMYRELENIGARADILFMQELIHDVDEEVIFAHEQLITLESINYDLDYILMEQEELYKKYKKKVGDD